LFATIEHAPFTHVRSGAGDDRGLGARRRPLRPRVAANESRLPEHYRTFTTALSIVESRFVEKVETDQLVYGAISGMLQTLDPHSSFMDPGSTRNSASGRRAGTTASGSRST
jgi:C-terminal processing protease CtpA/Prc